MRSIGVIGLNILIYYCTQLSRCFIFININTLIFQAAKEAFCFSIIQALTFTVRPYLLRNLEIRRPNQVWGVDITYIRMSKGFMYLFIIIDWYSRYIVDYELSSTLDKSFVQSCLKRALAIHL